MRRAFTLVELLAVIAIIGVLLALFLERGNLCVTMDLRQEELLLKLVEPGTPRVPVE